MGAIDTLRNGAKLWQVGEPEYNSNIAEDDVGANAPVTDKVTSLATTSVWLPRWTAHCTVTSFYQVDHTIVKLEKDAAPGILNCRRDLWGKNSGKGEKQFYRKLVPRYGP